MGDSVITELCNVNLPKRLRVSGVSVLDECNDTTLVNKKLLMIFMLFLFHINYFIRMVQVTMENHLKIENNQLAPY